MKTAIWPVRLGDSFTTLVGGVMRVSSFFAGLASSGFATSALIVVRLGLGLRRLAALARRFGSVWLHRLGRSMLWRFSGLRRLVGLGFNLGRGLSRPPLHPCWRCARAWRHRLRPWRCRRRRAGFRSERHLGRFRFRGLLLGRGLIGFAASATSGFASPVVSADFAGTLPAASAVSIWLVLFARRIRPHRSS